jgi:hypothetical protein
VFDLLIARPICDGDVLPQTPYWLTVGQKDCADIVLASPCDCFCLLFYAGALQICFCEQ